MASVTHVFSKLGGQVRDCLSTSENYRRSRQEWIAGREQRVHASLLAAEFLGHRHNRWFIKVRARACVCEMYH